MADPLELQERTPRFHALDLMRGVVCLYILIEHAGVALWASAGTGTGFVRELKLLLTAPLHWNIGTPLFFAMSGYCLAASVDSYRRRGESARSFLSRRLTRIFPSYWAAFFFFVLVVAVLDLVGLERWHRGGLSLELPSPGQMNLAQWIGNLTLTETWRGRFGGGEELIFTRIAWSLCFQEQFYLVCFLILALFRDRFHVVLAAVTGFALLSAAIAYDTGFFHLFIGFLPAKWHEFAVGLAVYWILHKPLTKRCKRALIAYLFLLALGGAWLGQSKAMAAGLFGIALLGIHRFDATIHQFAWLDPIRACGRRSYSVYLIHLPVVMVMVNLLDLPALQSFAARALIVVPLAVAAALRVAWWFDACIDRPIAQNAARRPAPALAAQARPQVMLESPVMARVTA